MACFAIMKHKGWLAREISLAGSWNDEGGSEAWLNVERIHR